MKLKLLALAGIMAATMGLTACDSNKENAAEDLTDAKEELTDAKENLAEGEAEGEAIPTEAVEAVNTADAEISQAQANTATDEMDAEVPMDGTTTSMDIASETDPAVAGSDDVVVVEKPAQ